MFFTLLINMSNFVSIGYYILYDLLEGRIQTQHRAHGPSPRMGKGLFKHQSRPETWTKFEEWRHRNHANPDFTCGLKSEDGKRTDPSSEELEERMHFGNASIDHLHKKVWHHGRHKRRASKEERRYLEKVAITSTFIALH